MPPSSPTATFGGLRQQQQHLASYFLLLILLTAYAEAEVCPTDNSAEGAAAAGDSSYSQSSSSSAGEQIIGPVKRLLLKPKTCPDFKDDADQDQCCPSSIAFGTYYCCTLEQKHEILAAALSERRRAFVKKYLAVIIIVAIALSVVGIVAASVICKRVRFCPLHHSKGSSASDSRSSASFQLPSRYYQTIGQGPITAAATATSNSLHLARHSVSMTGAAVTNSLNNQTPPQLNKTLISYDAPPPYESHESYRSLAASSEAGNPGTVTRSGAQLQHEYNLILENQLNNIIESRPNAADSQPQRSNYSLVSTMAGGQRPTNVFTTIPPPPSMQPNFAETLNSVE